MVHLSGQDVWHAWLRRGYPEKSWINCWTEQGEEEDLDRGGSRKLLEEAEAWVVEPSKEGKDFLHQRRIALSTFEKFSKREISLI